LGWSTERWRNATFVELNYAIEGYWRNWEWRTAWLAREINYTTISISAIPLKDEPRDKKRFMPLSIDKKEEERLTDEELTNAENKI